ncbi:hypothetical protein SB658_22405, partial [Bacillus sp. SIMBA_008]|uniref:tRNA threonylcarbamoyladenosine biosynthesis protein TsaB n=1 Tax=Bacillus sp. SIMBA_008 TaxID=3085757 RepID=UPI00397C0C8C
LRALALRAPVGAERVLACIDARMGEVYAACFARDGGAWTALSNEMVLAPEAFALPDDSAGWQAVGSGMAAAGELLQQRLSAQLAGVDASALPHAADVLALALPALARGEGVAADRIEPA